MSQEYRKKTKRAQDTTPLMGDYPWAHYDIRENGTIHAYSTQADNASEAWFQGKTGAYRIVNNDGSVSSHSPGESRIEMESATFTVSENLDFHGGGHLTVKTKGGMEMQVSGEGNITIAGATGINLLDHCGIIVQGNATLSVKGNLNLNSEAGSININGKSGVNIGSSGGIKMQAASIAMQESGDGADGYVG